MVTILLVISLQRKKTVNSREQKNCTQRYYFLSFDYKKVFESLKSVVPLEHLKTSPAPY
jgi:hypothetical protein